MLLWRAIPVFVRSRQKRALICFDWTRKRARFF